jgi:hypothetical protein
MQTSTIPALLDKNFAGAIAMSMTHYQDEGVYILKDNNGTDALNEKFEYINQ